MLIFLETYGEITAGIMPILTSGKPNLVPFSAITKSHAEARPMPPPKHIPCTCAIVGIGQSDGKQ